LIITRKSLISGEVRQREIEVSSDQLDNWRNGKNIQDACPDLSADDREFIMTGSVPEEWDSLSIDDFDEDSEDGEWPF
jgi:hypothetical protein